MKRVAIGIATKNCEDTVRETVCSVARQTYPHELMEIIVVDGNSSDKTLSIVSEVLSRTDIQWQVYSDGGKGLGVARQVVVHEAQADYLVWVDSDVTVPEDHVGTLVEFMERNPGLGGARAMQEIANQTSLIARVENLSLMLKRGPLNVFDNNGIFRTKAMREVGGFDPHIKGAGEDVDLIMRMMRTGWLFSVSKAKFYHRLGSWNQIWQKRVRAGYGIHYLKHKHTTLSSPWNHTLPISWLVGVRDSMIAYRLTRQKASFLIPLLYSLKSVPWFAGFMKSHIDGYGHA